MPTLLGTTPPPNIARMSMVGPYAGLNPQSATAPQHSHTGAATSSGVQQAASSPDVPTDAIFPMPGQQPDPAMGGDPAAGGMPPGGDPMAGGAPPAAPPAPPPSWLPNMQGNMLYSNQEGGPVTSQVPKVAAAPQDAARAPGGSQAGSDVVSGGSRAAARPTGAGIGLWKGADELAMLDLQQKAVRAGKLRQLRKRRGEDPEGRVPSKLAGLLFPLTQMETGKLAELRRSAVGESGLRAKEKPWSLQGEDAWPQFNNRRRDSILPPRSGSKVAFSLALTPSLSPTAQGFLSTCLDRGCSPLEIRRLAKEASELDAQVARDLAPLVKHAFSIGGGLASLGRGIGNTFGAIGGAARGLLQMPVAAGMSMGGRMGQFVANRLPNRGPDIKPNPGGSWEQHAARRAPDPWVTPEQSLTRDYTARGDAQLAAAAKDVGRLFTPSQWGQPGHQGTLDAQNADWLRQHGSPIAANVTQGAGMGAELAAGMAATGGLAGVARGAAGAAGRAVPQLMRPAAGAAAGGATNTGRTAVNLIPRSQWGSAAPTVANAGRLAGPASTGLIRHGGTALARPTAQAAGGAGGAAAGAGPAAAATGKSFGRRMLPWAAGAGGTVASAATGAYLNDEATSQAMQPMTSEALNQLAESGMPIPEGLQDAPWQEQMQFLGDKFLQIPGQVEKVTDSLQQVAPLMEQAGVPPEQWQQAVDNFRQTWDFTPIQEHLTQVSKTFADQTGGGNWLAKLVGGLFGFDNQFVRWLSQLDGYQATALLGAAGLGLFGVIQAMSGNMGGAGLGLGGAALAGGMGLLGPQLLGQLWPGEDPTTAAMRRAETVGLPQNEQGVPVPPMPHRPQGWFENPQPQPGTQYDPMTPLMVG